jgi:aspartate kinase
MIIMKFGGTSVGAPEPFATALRLVKQRVEREPVVVVSALAGVTDLLVEFCARPAERQELAARMIERHTEFVRATGLPPETATDLIHEWEEEADNHQRGAHASLPLTGADQDRVLSYGERFSAVLFAAGLDLVGVPAVPIVAGDAGLVTDDHFGGAQPLPEAESLLSQALARKRPVLVVTGFLGRTPDGRITTLGRGGSDYTASFLGAALAAEEIQIWTDTNGMLSADPGIVPEARPVPHLSFAEASELAYFGARVLHPKTILPAMERAIPVRVLNTLRPEDPGSLITPVAGAADSTWRVKSIACKRGITAVTIVSTRMLLAYGFLARVFEVFGRHRIAIDLVTTSEVSISVTLDDTDRLDTAIAELEGIGRIESQGGLAVVAVVGEGAPERIALTGHIFTLLGGVGIEVEMISQGASRVNLSFVVREGDAERAVRLLHRGLGLDAEIATATATATAGVTGAAAKSWLDR